MDPAQTTPTSSQPSNIPICQNCTTSTTPLWRRSDAGQILCNACGLFLKLHNRPRPISLKTNIIKSRNRVKPTNKSSTTTTTNTASTTEGQGKGQGEKRISYPASYPSTGGNGNIAPQHLFDNAIGTLSPSDLAMTETVGGGGDGDVVFVGESSGEVVANLRTRVSELEVINELFRGRVGELEVSEREAREEVERLNGEVEELKARLGVEGGEGGRKRARVDDGEGVEARETSSNFMMP